MALRYDDARAKADQDIDLLGADGRLSRKRKVIEDAMSAVGELDDLLAADSMALQCVVHRPRQPTRCPVCALVTIREKTAKLKHVYASGR